MMHKDRKRLRGYVIINRRKRCFRAGRYLVLTEFVKDGSNEILKSRRYIKIGEVEKLAFWEVEP